MSKIIAESVINLGKRQMQFCFILSFVFHLILLYRKTIPLETFLVGMGMLVIYYQYLRNFPCFHLNWPIMITTLGTYTYLSIEVRYVSYSRFTDKQISVGLIFNLWQWISEIQVENDVKELQSNIGFFVCVWMIPILLSLSLELSWCKATGVTSTRDLEESELWVLTKDSGLLRCFQRYFTGKRSQILML
jgi:hypothetical protein